MFDKLHRTSVMWSISKFFTEKVISLSQISSSDTNGFLKITYETCGLLEASMLEIILRHGSKYRSQLFRFSDFLSSVRSRTTVLPSEPAMVRIISSGELTERCFSALTTSMVISLSVTPDWSA